MGSTNPSALRRVTAAVLVGFAIAILCGLFFAWLGEEVLESDTVRFDQHVRALVHAESRPALTQAMEAATEIGSTVPVLILTLVVLLIFRLRNMNRDFAIFALTIGGAALLTYVLKIGFHRPRPTPYFGLAMPGSFSFPSGHSLTATSFYAMLAHLVNRRIRRNAIRLGIWVLAVLIILVIGFSRIYLGIHYASDVIGAYAAGIVWVLVVALVEPFIRHPRRMGSDQM